MYIITVSEFYFTVIVYLHETIYCKWDQKPEDAFANSSKVLTNTGVQLSCALRDKMFLLHYNLLYFL